MVRTYSQIKTVSIATRGCSMRDATHSLSKGPDLLGLQSFHRSSIFWRADFHQPANPSIRLLSTWFTNRSNKLLTRPDKDALRAMLETRVQEKLRHDRDSVVTYAAKPAPDRKPYTSKLTVQDKAFQKELQQMRADAEAGVIHTPKHEPHDAGALNLRLDDYPDL